MLAVLWWGLFSFWWLYVLGTQTSSLHQNKKIQVAPSHILIVCLNSNMEHGDQASLFAIGNRRRHHQQQQHDADLQIPRAHSSCDADASSLCLFVVEHHSVEESILEPVDCTIAAAARRCLLMIPVVEISLIARSSSSLLLSLSPFLWCVLFIYCAAVSMSHLYIQASICWHTPPYLYIRKLSV